MIHKKTVILLLIIGLVVSFLVSMMLGPINDAVIFVYDKNNTDIRIAGADAALIQLQPEEKIIGVQQTNHLGICVFRNLPDGLYKIRVAKEGFKTPPDQEINVEHDRIKDNPFLFFYLEH